MSHNYSVLSYISDFYILFATKEKNYGKTYAFSRSFYILSVIILSDVLSRTLHVSGYDSYLHKSV